MVSRNFISTYLQAELSSALRYGVVSRVPVDISRLLERLRNVEGANELWKTRFFF